MAPSRLRAHASATLSTWPLGRKAISRALGPGSSTTASSVRGVPHLELNGPCSVEPPASLLLFTFSGFCATAFLVGPAGALTISVLPTSALSARVTRARSGLLPHRWAPVQNGAFLALARGGHPPSAGPLCQTSASTPTSFPVPHLFVKLSALSRTPSSLRLAPSAAARSVASVKLGPSTFGPGARRLLSPGTK